MSPNVSWSASAAVVVFIVDRETGAAILARMFHAGSLHDNKNTKAAQLVLLESGNKFYCNTFKQVVFKLVKNVILFIGNANLSSARLDQVLRYFPYLAIGFIYLQNDHSFNY